MTNPAPAAPPPTPTAGTTGSTGVTGAELEIQQEIAQVADRVERLLLRHGELQRTNLLLAEQVRALTSERDSLRSRLSAARARVEALIERLPDNAPNTSPGALG